MYSRQLTRLTNAALTAILKIVKRSIGSSQLGFLTMSSNVFFGENSTPKTRPKTLICWGCDSGAAGDTAVVVAIGKSSTTRLRNPYCNSTTQGPTERFQRANSSPNGHGLSGKQCRGPCLPCKSPAQGDSAFTA